MTWGRVMTTIFMSVFITVFLAELGDKTQLATMLFSADQSENRWAVFFAAALALISSTAIAVVLGAVAERWFSALPLQLMAGAGFVIIGGWMIVGHFQSA